MAIIYFIFSIFLIPFLVWISYNDYRRHIIPNSALLFLFILSFLLNGVSITARLCGLSLSVPFFIYACITDKLGGGDVKLIACMGFILGIGAAAAALGLAYIGVAITLFLNLLKHKHTAKLAMGPYYCGGLAVCLALQHFFTYFNNYGGFI